MSGPHTCITFWNPPKSYAKDRFFSTQSAPPTSSTNITLNVSSAVNAFCSSSRGNCWTCCVTLVCRERYRNSCILHRKWWHCSAVCLRTTSWRRASRTGPGGGNCQPRTSRPCTSPPFWNLLLTVRKTFHVCLSLHSFTRWFIPIALKEQFTHITHLSSSARHCGRQASKETFLELHSKTCSILLNNWRINELNQTLLSPQWHPAWHPLQWHIHTPLSLCIHFRRRAP